MVYDVRRWGMRQSTLTREDIAVLLQTQDPQYRRCFLVNELGELAQAGDTEAEKILASFLDPEEEDIVRAAAYCHLSLKHERCERTRIALAIFARQTENARIVAWGTREHGITPPAAA